ncbi:MAG TPA: efflux RND transporter periplasmic adaptor subunit [Geobacteraceae bacterium]
MADQDLAGLKIDKRAAVSRPHLRRKKFLWLGLLAVVALVVVLFFTGVFTPAVEVEVATVSRIYPSQAFTLLNASGYVVAQRKAAVSSKATGRLEWLGVEEGNRVRRDQIIARLENRDVVASRDQAAANLKAARFSVDQARAELVDAGRNFNRQKELLAQGIVAQADYDAAEARYNKAKAGMAGAQSAAAAAAAALQGADVAVEYTLIRAPFDAVVLTKDADVGDVITPFGAAANAKASVVTIADLDSLQVEADVSEANLEKVRVGQPCEVQLDALPETRFAGAVHMIVPTADRSKATVLVKVRFLEKDSRVLPEMSAKVAFLERGVEKGERAPRTAVNPACLVTKNGRKIVFVVKGNRAVETEVRTGGQMGNMVEVVAGVKAGDKVVMKPVEKLRNGSRIKTPERG